MQGFHLTGCYTKLERESQILSLLFSKSPENSYKLYTEALYPFFKLPFLFSYSDPNQHGNKNFISAQTVTSMMKSSNPFAGPQVAALPSVRVKKKNKEDNFSKLQHDFYARKNQEEEKIDDHVLDEF